jgi:Protein of unknown function (DUF3467)
LRRSQAIKKGDFLLPEKPASEQPKELETVRSEKYFRIYSNATHLEVTPWDFTFIFGETKRGGDKAVIEQSVGIIMSPQHAKAFLKIFNDNLREYEKKVGEIKVPQPPDVVISEPTSGSQPSPDKPQ